MNWRGCPGRGLGALLDLSLFFITILINSGENLALGRAKYVHVSHHIGRDSTNCGPKITPCRTLSHGIRNAGWNDRIILDGTFCEWDPYTCERNNEKNRDLKNENRITVNVSLEIVSLGSPARVNCGDLLQFVASQYNNARMEVTFTGIVFYNTSMSFFDSSAFFVNCSFSHSAHPIKIWLSLGQTSTLAVKNSSFFDNTGCIQLKLPKTGAVLTLTLDSVDFQRNQPFSPLEGSGISVQDSSAATTQVRINISCNSTTFSNNIGPLITNNITFSKTNEYYHQVKFLKTSAGSNSLSTNGVYFSKANFAVVVFDDLLCTDNLNTRCIHIESSEASLSILNSNISGHKVINQPGAGILVQADKSIYSFISKTTLQRNKGEGGGAIALRSLTADVHLKLYKSHLLNNSACDNGGALLVSTKSGLVTIEVENTTVKYCGALENGGAFYITTEKEITIAANNSLWVYNKAFVTGAAIFVSSGFRDKRKTNLKVSAKIRNCKFIRNIDHGASVLINAAVGHVDVFQTEWIKNTDCFHLECNCVVNFTKVNISSTFFTAIHISSGDNKYFGNSAMKIHFERCVFDFNKGDHIFVDSKSLYLYLILNNVHVNGEKMVARGTKSVLNVYVAKESALESTIRINNVLVKNSVGSSSVIFRIMTNAFNKVEILNCVFSEIKSVYSDKYHTTASPLSFVMPFDKLSDNVCNSSYLRFVYRNTITIKNTTFKNNIGRVSGGIFLTNGNVTIRNSSFENNYAINIGGHIHVGDGNARVEIEHSTFRQELPETKHNGETFTHDTSIYSESNGLLVLKETLITAELEKDSYRLFTVAKAGLVKFDDHTKAQCAVGSWLRFDNFSHFTVLMSKCKFKTTVMTLTCHRCPPGLYSLNRGELRGPPEKQKLKWSGSFCTTCPYGANCSRNIFAKPNFYGYPDSNGSLMFVNCPPNYCTPTKTQHQNLSVYNSCYGNRDGFMCGRCKTGYTETLFARKCKQNEKCKDQWIWFVTFIYAVAMALFLIYQPPIVQILVRNTLWFRKASPNRMEYQSLDQQTKFNGGYMKIIFYFYQIASYVAVEPLSHVFKHVLFVSFFSGLLNFHPRIATGGFGCPFPGLNVVTKELLLSSGVFATLLSVQGTLLSHLAFNKLTGRPHPSTAPYIAASLETLLLGYATLANTSLKLLTCVPVLSESRLYYDANIACLEWWQYFFIAYVLVFLFPFVVVIYWGAMKLRRKLISVEHFIGACFFPLGFIVFWLIQKLACPQSHQQSSNLTDKRGQRVLKILHDPFRPPSPGETGSLYWESVLIGRRFLLLSYQVFFPDPLLRLFCMDMTCLLIFVWHVAIKPFRDWKANVIEAVSLAVLVVIATINLVQAIFVSASITPNGPVKSHLILLEQLEMCLLGVVPLSFGLLCLFAIFSQLVRIFVLLIRFLYFLLHQIFSCIVLHRLKNKSRF